MQTTLALVALAAVAYAAPQSVAAAPASCSASYSGAFEITVVDPLAKRDSTCGQEGYLTLTLANGVLSDAKGRTGYIASNFQFQFDAPPQAGTIVAGGFSVCQNGSLALGSSAVFYKCLSGDFYNLYDRHWAPQCAPILIEVMPCGATVPAPVTQIVDGQPQAPTGIPVSEFPDGQPQVVTYMPKPPVTQISDGQIQATTGVPSPVVSGVPVTQISDGQIQATATPVPAPGTPATGSTPSSATSGVGSSASVSVPASSRTTGVPSAGASGTPTPVPATGAANGFTVTSSFAAVVFGLAAVILL